MWWTPLLLIHLKMQNLHLVCSVFLWNNKKNEGEIVKENSELVYPCLFLWNNITLFIDNHTEKVLRHEDLQGAPLLILANKQVSLSYILMWYDSKKKCSIKFIQLCPSSSQQVRIELDEVKQMHVLGSNFVHPLFKTIELIQWKANL